MHSITVHKAPTYSSPLYETRTLIIPTLQERKLTRGLNGLPEALELATLLVPLRYHLLLILEESWVSPRLH